MSDDSAGLSVTGVIHEILEIQSGEGRNGTWRRGGFVLETGGQYPKHIQFDVWGDRLDTITFAEGMHVEVHFDVESREWEGRWFTNAKAWKVVDREADTKKMMEGREKGGPSWPNDPPADSPMPSDRDMGAGPEDDLPF